MRKLFVIVAGVLAVAGAACWSARNRVTGTEPIVVPSVSLQTATQREAPGNTPVLVKVKIIEADHEAVNAAWKKSAEGQANSALATAATGIYSVDQSNSIVTELLKDNHTSVLGDPSIVVVSGYTASFNSGGKVGIPTIVGVGPSAKTTTVFRSVGLSAVLAPTVLENGSIRLKVICESNQLDEANRVGGIPGFKTRRVNLSPMLLKPGQSVIAFVTEPEVNAHKSDTDSKAVAQKEPNRVTFVIATPEVQKPMVADNDSTTPPRGSVTTFVPYAPSTDAPQSITGRLLPVDPPAAGWPPATLIPFADRFMPNPGVFNFPTHPVELTRLQHLESAKSHLAQAGLSDQAAAIAKEIQLEQRALAKRELQRKERELEQLKTELESLRRSLTEDSESNLE